MSIGLYDKALVDKIQRWIPEQSNLKVTSPDETSLMFSIKADEQNDKPLTLPLIALSRDRDIELNSTKKQPKSFDGFALEQTSTKSSLINVIPYTVRYQLDIYTKFRAEADEYLRNFVFNFINYPMLQVVLPYNGYELPQNATIELDKTISDNSDVKERLFEGQFTRYTIKLTILDAYLSSIPIKQNATLSLSDVELVVKDRQK